MSPKFIVPTLILALLPICSILGDSQSDWAAQQAADAAADAARAARSAAAEIAGLRADQFAKAKQEEEEKRRDRESLAIESNLTKMEAQIKAGTSLTVNQVEWLKTASLRAKSILHPEYKPFVNRMRDVWLAAVALQNKR